MIIKKIGIAFSVLLFIAGAIGQYLSFGQTEFSSPNEGRFFSIGIFPYILLVVGAITGFALYWRILGKNDFAVPFALAILLIIATIVSTLQVSSWVIDRDLERHGIRVLTTVDSTTFEWVKTKRGGGEWLYYGFAYQLKMNDSVYQFKQWRKISNHNLRSRTNPVITHEMMADYNIIQPGDTLLFLASTRNPRRQRLIKGQ